MVQIIFKGRQADLKQNLVTSTPSGAKGTSRNIDLQKMDSQADLVNLVRTLSEPE